MTILYKVQNSEGRDASANKSVICKISAKNIVAYCISQDADSQSGINHHVYVCDIVTPWQFFKVCSSKYAVNALEWNGTGEYLLIGYNGGNVEIWSTRNQILNSWVLSYKANFPSEDIIDAKFFHNGKSVYFHTQKKELPLYADKFERLEYRPTLVHFGSAAVEGCIIITASGLLGAFVIPKLCALTTPETASSVQAPQSVELVTATHSIGLSRSFITSCSMSYCPSGCLKLAISFGRREQLIHCFKVSLKLEHEDTVHIKCESLASVFLNPQSGEPKHITHLRWSSSHLNHEDVIYVAYNCGENSRLEQWNLTKKHQGVHKLLQKNKGDFIQCEYWEQTSQIHFNAAISEITLPKFHSDSGQLYVILRDNSVQILEPGLKKLGGTMFERLADERQCGCKFVSADVTYMTQLLLIFDNLGQMYAMQVSNPQLDKGYKLSTLSLQVSLLEYCIITGVDASDVLLLNLPQLDVLIEKLTENFTRQPTFTRHFYYSNFLSLKSNMCRIQSRQHDFDNLILLHSISITFKSLLRPSEDKSPAENLAMILNEPLPDVDKVLLNLDAKDFTVEPFTLQSLQQLIQWVADLALNILNKLPEEVMKAKLHKKPGYDISRDIVAIGSIRELLVMIRIWGLLNAQCLPIYTKSLDNLDVLAVLFRLLTRLAQNTAEPDEMLLDECITLSTQVLIPPRQYCNPTTLLNSHVSMMKSFPLVFTTAVEPIGLQDVQMKEVVFSNGTRDGVSNLQLGSKANPIRKCIRCGFVNSVNKVAITSALKAWCYRWIYCHCGGYWKVD